MDAKPEKNQETSWRLTSGRLLAGFALVFCVPVGVLFVSVAMFVDLLVGQGVIPGGAYDRLVDGWFRDKPTAYFAND